jgi:hypothetical protein
MSAAFPSAVFLRNQRLGLRAPLVSDAVDVDIWHPRPDTLSVDAAAQILNKGERIPWGGNPVIRLMAVRPGSGDMVAGAVVTRSANRTSTLVITCPDADPDRPAILLDLLGLLVPWLLQELGVMTVVLDTPEDDVAMVGAASAAGMRIVVRRREHILRPTGRVDRLQMERVNLDWGHYDG